MKAVPENVKEHRASLAKLADICRSDIFNSALRAHSSVVGEGFRVNVPVSWQGNATTSPRLLTAPPSPVCDILGGVKVVDKIQLIMDIRDKISIMIIGGGIAFTFIKEAGVEIGASLYDENGANLVLEIKHKAEDQGVELTLPVDFVRSSKMGEDGEVRSGDLSTGVPEGFQGLDIGPKSIELNDAAIAKSKTVVRNGPMGVFEMGAFEAGTKRMMENIAEVTAAGATSVIGGGDTSTVCKEYVTVDKVSHCSTGDGASLELWEGLIEIIVWTVAT